MSSRTLPIFLCFFLMGLVDAMGPLAGMIQKQYAISGFMAGLLPASAFVAFALFSVPGGVLAARIGMRSLLILALALNALGLVIPAVVMPGYTLLLGSVFVLGVGTTLLQVAGNPIMRDVSSPGRFARNLSFAQFIKGVGSVSSTALVAALAVGATGWRRVFPVFLALTLVGLGSLLLLKIEPKRAGSPPSIAGSLALLKERAFGLAVFGIFLYVGAEVGLTTWLSRRLEGLLFAGAGVGWAPRQRRAQLPLVARFLPRERGARRARDSGAAFGCAEPGCRRRCRLRSRLCEHLAAPVLADRRGAARAQRRAVGPDVHGDLRRRCAAAVDGAFARRLRRL